MKIYKLLDSVKRAWETIILFNKQLGERGVWVNVAYIAVAAISAAAGGYATYDSGQQRKKESRYQADVAAENALAEKDKAKYDAKMHRENVQRVLASQRALYGKSGLTGEGSPLLVMEESAKQGEMDALAIRYGGDIRASQQRSASNLYRMQGKNAARAGNIGAGSTLLGGASNVASGYRQMSKDHPG